MLENIDGKSDGSFRECSTYYPKVLVISHNVFSKNTPMGKTLDTFFHGWDKKNIIQIFFHSEVPTSDVCTMYYRFTDVDALKAIIFRMHQGEYMSSEDLKLSRDTAVNTQKLTKIYNFGRKRLTMTYVLRDALWSMTAWRSKSFMKWLNDFNPEIIFFASSDYGFSYKIALSLANILKIPLITCCFDDYYLFNKNEKSYIGRLRHKYFRRVVKATMKRSSYVVTVNDSMSKVYTELFQKECPVLYTATYIRNQQTNNIRRGISYLGGLGLKRYEQLIDIGLTLKNMTSDEIPKFIDVYSGETDSTILKKMTLENGINFHGNVSQSEVAKIIARSMAVIHTESFDNEIKQRVMYSLSTKIPDSLASGACLLAYGPAEIASIDYLLKNDVAFVATNKDELKEKIEIIFTSEEERLRITNNAKKLAQNNHDSNTIPEHLREILINAIMQWRKL